MYKEPLAHALTDMDRDRISQTLHPYLLYLIENIDPLEKHGKTNRASDSFSCKLHGLFINQGLTLLPKRNDHVFF